MNKDDLCIVDIGIEWNSPYKLPSHIDLVSTHYVPHSPAEKAGHEYTRDTQQEAHLIHDVVGEDLVLPLDVAQRQGVALGVCGKDAEASEVQGGQDS